MPLPVLPSHFLLFSLLPTLTHCLFSTETPTLYMTGIWVDCQPLGQGALSYLCVPGPQSVLIKGVGSMAELVVWLLTSRVLDKHFLSRQEQVMYVPAASTPGQSCRCGFQWGL